MSWEYADYLEYQRELFEARREQAILEAERELEEQQEVE